MESNPTLRIQLTELHDDSELAAWRDEIAYVQADQARQRREHAFQAPRSRSGY